MTVNELYRNFLQQLRHIYEQSEAANICTILFEQLAGVTRSAIIKDPAFVLDEKVTLKLQEALEDLKTHKPIQYVLGEAWFYHMKLKVSPAVLIPRPETEELVDLAIKHLKDFPATNLIDIGTGSGCIPIAIKKNIPGVEITAVDLSNDALIIASENAAQQKTPINFKELDFLDEKNWTSFPTFDVIISNPPYIPANEKELLDKNVTAFEPHTALFVTNEQPLIFYEKIAAFGKEHLSVHGKIFMEVHEHFAKNVASLFGDEYYTAEIKHDLQGKERMLIVSRRYR